MPEPTAIDIHLPAPSDPLIAQSRGALKTAEAVVIGNALQLEMAQEDLKFALAKANRMRALHQFYRRPIDEAGALVDATFGPVVEAYEAAAAALRLKVLEYQTRGLQDQRKP